MANIFGERLEILMNEQKLTQVKLADDLQMKKQSINSYLKGKSRPELDALIRFADYFDCSIDFLLGREDFRSHSQMKSYDRMIEENFKNSLNFLGVDKREYYLQTITQFTRSYHTTEGKRYSGEHFNLTIGIIEQITEITSLIAKIDNDTLENKPIAYHISEGKTATVDSHSAEYVLILRTLLQTAMDDVCREIKELGAIGFSNLEERFPLADAVLNLSKRNALQTAKRFVELIERED